MALPGNYREEGPTTCAAGVDTAIFEADTAGHRNLLIIVRSSSGIADSVRVYRTPSLSADYVEEYAASTDLSGVGASSAAIAFVEKRTTGRLKVVVNSVSGAEVTVSVRGSAPLYATEPVLSSISPTTVLRDTPIAFTVTEVGTERKPLITIQFGGSDVVEVVYDGTSFTGKYAGYSGRWEVTGGYGFSILRSGGWPITPTLRVYGLSNTLEE
jgi:hypothetical protein